MDDKVTKFWCTKPNGTRFQLRVFGDGDLRFSSRGPVECDDGKWAFTHPCKDGVVLEHPVE